MKTQHLLFHLGVMGLLTSYAPIQVLAGSIFCSECDRDFAERDQEEARDKNNHQTDIRPGESAPQKYLIVKTERVPRARDTSFSQKDQHKRGVGRFFCRSANI